MDYKDIFTKFGITAYCLLLPRRYRSGQVLLTASCFLLFASHHSLLITHLNPPLQLKPQSFAGHGEGKGGGNGFLQVFVDGMQLVIGMHGVVVGQQELLYTA